MSCCGLWDVGSEPGRTDGFASNVVRSRLDVDGGRSEIVIHWLSRKN